MTHCQGFENRAMVTAWPSGTQQSPSTSTEVPLRQFKPKNKQTGRTRPSCFAGAWCSKPSTMQKSACAGNPLSGLLRRLHGSRRALTGRNCRAAQMEPVPYRTPMFAPSTHLLSTGVATGWARIRPTSDSMGCRLARWTTALGNMSTAFLMCTHTGSMRLSVGPKEHPSLLSLLHFERKNADAIRARNRGGGAQTRSQTPRPGQRMPPSRCRCHRPPKSPHFSPSRTGFIGVTSTCAFDSAKRPSISNAGVPSATGTWQSDAMHHFTGRRDKYAL
jgi:hypothetical protein